MPDDDGVLRVSLDWPDQRNALGPEEADELVFRLRDADSPGCRAVVLGAEGRVFSAGGDLRAVVGLVEEGEDALRDRLYRSFQGLFRELRAVPVPVVAAVTGPAVGLGLDLALACDLRFVGPDVWVRQGWSSLGLVPATGGFLDARSLGGPQAPWRLLAAGEAKIEAAQLERWGLAEIDPDPAAAALAAARTFAAQPRDRIVAMKRLIGEADPERHLAAALDAQVGFLLDPHFKESADRILGPR